MPRIQGGGPWQHAASKIFVPEKVSYYEMSQTLTNFFKKEHSIPSAATGVSYRPQQHKGRKWGCRGMVWGQLENTWLSCAWSVILSSRGPHIWRLWRLHEEFCMGPCRRPSWAERQGKKWAEKFVTQGSNASCLSPGPLLSLGSALGVVTVSWTSHWVSFDIFKWKQKLRRLGLLDQSLLSSMRWNTVSFGKLKDGNHL